MIILSVNHVKEQFESHCDTFVCVLDCLGYLHTSEEKKGHRGSYVRRSLLCTDDGVSRKRRRWRVFSVTTLTLSKCDRSVYRLPKQGVGRRSECGQVNPIRCINEKRIFSQPNQNISEHRISYNYLLNPSFICVLLLL